MGTTVQRKANRFRIKKRQCREDNDDVQVEVKDKTVRQRELHGDERSFWGMRTAGK